MNQLMSAMPLLLPVATAIGALFIARSHGIRGTTAVLRISVLVPSAAFFFVTVVSVPHLLTATNCALFWATGAVGTWAYVIVRGWRSRNDLRGLPARILKRLRESFRALTAEEWIGGTIIAVLVAGELVVCLISLPSSLDGLSYHLARVEHWRVNASIGPYATGIERQVMFAPGAEYLMLMVRLLTDSIRLGSLVAWAASIGVVVLAYRIAGQLGSGRRGRIAAAVLAATMPMVVIQASSPLNDVVCAFFVLCFASLVLEFRLGGGGWWLATLTGLALGAALLTKSTAFPLAAGIGLWWAWLLIRRWRTELVWAIPGSVAVAAVTGPFLAMVASIWGSPLGGGQATGETVLKDHSPVGIALNLAKAVVTMLFSEYPYVNRAMCSGLWRLHGALGRDINDPNTVFHNYDFRCQYYLGELTAPAPWQVLAALCAVTVLIAIGTGIQRQYALATLVAAVAFSAVVAYQPFLTRLVVPGVLLAVPLIPAAWGSATLGRLSELTWSRLRISADRTRQLRTAVAGALVVCATIGGVQALMTAKPRALSERQFYHQRGSANQMRLWATGMGQAVAHVKTVNAKVIGLHQRSDNPEFSLWVVSGAIHDQARIVTLNSVIPGYPPPVVNHAWLDVVICAEQMLSKCDPVIPVGWRKTVHQSEFPVIVAVNPTHRADSTP